MYGNSKGPSGFPDGFSVSKSCNSATLTVTRHQAEDETEYYCLTWDKSLNAEQFAGLWGRETKTCCPSGPIHLL